MKCMKKYQKLLAAMILMGALALFMSLSAFADTIPSKVRAYPKQITSVYVSLSTAGDTIRNVKGTSMKLKVTRENYSDDDPSEYTITYMPKKKGKLKITFDVYGKDGKKKSSKKITVFSYPGTPIKSIKYAGKNLFMYGDNYKKAGKLVVKMNSGYKLVKIELGCYGNDIVNKSTYSTHTHREMQYKTVKNKSKITLGKKGYYYLSDAKYDDGSFYHSESSEVYVTNYIRITYKDKYTKQETTTSYPITRIVW